MKLPVALLAAMLFAGCVGPAAPPPGTGQIGASAYATIEEAIGAPVVGDHDHTDPKLHHGSYNLERLAVVTGHDGAPPQGESFAETAVKGGYAYLTRYGPESGLVIFDVSDPTQPKFTGSIRLDEGFEPDIEISDDGHWAFWETQRFPIGLPTTPSYPDVGGNAPHGVHIIDISDKTNPRWAGFYPVDPDGPHSITYANISGRNILFLSVYAFAYAYENVEVPQAQRLIITELDTSVPGVAQLKKLAEYREPGATGKAGLMPHDVSIQQHPFTHRWLAYVAYWNVGLVILDVTDPAHPEHVSTYTDFGPAAYRNLHMVHSFPHLIDGRHVSVAEPEIGGAKDTGYLTFIDTTDPANPAYLSSWLLPGNLTSQGLTFSPHYFDVADGRVAMASYHAGVWVIDVHDQVNLMHPRSVAFAEVANDHLDASALPVGVPSFFGGGAGSAFDAWWYHGLIYVGDASNGLAVYRYTGPAPAPVEQAS